MDQRPRFPHRRANFGEERNTSRVRHRTRQHRDACQSVCRRGEGGKSRIVVEEIPYQVNKARLIEKIAELVREKKIEDITDLRDGSDREGLRIVIELRRDANPQVVLNNLQTDGAADE